MTVPFHFKTYDFKKYIDITIKFIIISLNLQSIITVTFEVPGNAKEESLNVFIQVNAIVNRLMINQLYCYIVAISNG